MKKITSHAHKTERGQSLVELGISLMILLMLLTGAVETSLALFQFVTIRDAAQEGALYGSIAMQDAATVGEAVQGIQWRAIQTADDVVAIGPNNIEVFINKTIPITTASTTVAEYCEGAIGILTNSIKVDISFQHPITFPFVAAMTGQEVINLHASATNTILQPACPLPP